MKTILVRNVPEDVHQSVKIACAVEGRSINESVIALLHLKAEISDPRSAAMENIEFRLVPHRTDDSKDDNTSWAWKLQTYHEEDGSLELYDSRLI